VLPLLLLQSLGPKLPADVSSVLGQEGVRAAFAIWTTTPWTIPANLAVAVNADLDYCLVKAEVGGLMAACLGLILALVELMH
jgi:isoleucyl-tRNA synthetase